MNIRRYTKADIPDLVKYLKLGLQDFHYQRIWYDADKMTDMFEGNLRNPQFFVGVVIADDGQLAGALCASVVEYMFSHETYAEHHATYIRDEYRSLKAITGLVKLYQKWAKDRGVKQVRWSQSTGYKLDKFGVLARRLGFEQIGTNWNMEIEG